jgi:class 3 adenylate cyclase/DNA-binding SARP family transcriptional activator
MDFRVLGPLEVRGERGVVHLGGLKPRAVLAVLLLHANEPVSSARLVEAVWGQEESPTRRKSLQVCVSRLRKALGDPAILARKGATYEVRVAPGELDSERFERLVDAGRRALADGEAEQAAATLRRALALWRGAPLADLSLESFAATDVARLEEHRLAALEARVEADLASGRHAALAGELRQLLAEHPTREPFVGQLMLALYRCGRQVEALETYRTARRTLVDEVGVEPGPELRRLHEAILRQDPALDHSPVLDDPLRERHAEPAPPKRVPERPGASGAALADETEARKIVTVLFTDISSSTGLGEALDPEALEQMLARYFAEMKLVVERHEGVVSKFIGDAVMAVFGLPRVHEDDALRAVRAAAEMRDTLAALNERFAASWGVRLAVRTGVNTGEVFVREPGDGQSLVVGDAVNTAARLEQVAEPGAILIGEDTHRLVHGAVIADPLDPLELKGKAAPVHAWRLVEVVADVPGWSRRLDCPLVDRERELAQLEGAVGRVADSGTCELVTVIAAAGLGKSRLTGELLSRLGSRATVLQGRCLPYGDGITFWPIVSVLRDAVGIEDRDSEAEARRKLSELFPGDDDHESSDGELVWAALAPLLGRGMETVGIQETYWAIRKLLERLAGWRPVVAVFDDIHWGEPTFLDLVEYLADWIRSAPVLLVCQARPELLDVRPGWMTAKENASTVTLLPFDAPQTDDLMRGLIGGTDLPEGARSRIAAVAEGNPLFVEETVRMLVDDGLVECRQGRWTITGDLSSITIPPTIHALLIARLDRLEPEERGAIERAAAVGRSFWWGAVAELSPPELRSGIAACLQSLVRKQLIAPDRSNIPQEDAFRFTHILVRDAAYQGIPKAVRAEMHERLAEWIEVKTRDLAGEYEEIVGYHLEQAHRSLVELGPPTGQARALAARSAVLLSSAGERAFARGDMPAAVNLLSRATALLPAHDPRRLELLPQLAFALMETADFDRLLAIAREMDEAATDTGDTGLRAHAIVLGLWIRLFTNPEGWAAEAEREAERAIANFHALGDERGLARAWSLLGLVQMLNARLAQAEEAWSRAVEHAERAGNRRDAFEGLSWVPVTVWAGPTPAEEGIRRCREVFERAHGDRKAMSTALFSQAGLEASLGHFDQARELFGRARAMLEEVALPVWKAGGLTQVVGWALLLEDKPEAAERELRCGYDTLREIGEVTFLSTVAGILAEVLYVLARYDEAERFTQIAEESAGAEDVYTHALWRSVRAKCVAQRGGLDEALRLAGEAVDLVASTDSLHLHWHTLMCHGAVLTLAGRTGEAKAAVRQAISAAERKGAVIGTQLGRDTLDGLLGSPVAARSRGSSPVLP